LEASEKNIHQDLIDKCRLNDKRAQFEIYKLYYKQMYNTSLRILSNKAEAEDIMQDSFLDAFSKIGEFKGDGNFGGWLRRIVVNNSIDALKKKKETVLFEENKVELEYEKDEYTENVEYRVEEIKKAMGLLPEEHRMIISLFLFEGYDHDEIAQILGISNNASRTRFSRAKGKLLRVLSEQRTIKMFHPN
jgi:RNA polymerase sigma-70 factor (ECF subfamily)